MNAESTALNLDDTTEPTNKPAVLLLRASAAAAICSVSERTWRAWDAAGNIPQPMRFGRLTRWRADELRAWVAAGCPRRKDWELLQS